MLGNYRRDRICSVPGIARVNPTGCFLLQLQAFRALSGQERTTSALTLPFPFSSYTTFGGARMFKLARSSRQLASAFQGVRVSVPQRSQRRTTPRLTIPLLIADTHQPAGAQPVYPRIPLRPAPRLVRYRRSQGQRCPLRERGSGCCPEDRRRGHGHQGPGACWRTWKGSL